MACMSYSCAPLTHFRTRKNAAARGTHHLSSFLCHNLDTGVLRKLKGLFAGCDENRSVTQQYSSCMMIGLTSATSTLFLISRSAGTNSFGLGRARPSKSLADLG